MPDSGPAPHGLRLAVDWRMVGRPGAPDTDIGRYQRALTHALADQQGPCDEIWALVAWAAAVEQLPDGVAHAGVGSHGIGWRGTLDALGWIAPDLAIFAETAPPHPHTPVCVVLHDALFATHREWMPADAPARSRARVARAVGDACAVIATSSAARADILTVLDVAPDHVRVVAPAPAPAFVPRADADRRVADRLGLSRYCVVLGDTGARGNLECVAQAVARLGRPGLVAVSAEPGPSGCRTRVMPGGIRFVGPLDDDARADLLSGAEFAVSGSLYDGCGIGVLEALACGVPVVATDRGALSEVAGDAALVVPPTLNAIAEAVRAVCELGCANRLREAGPAQAARFSGDRMGSEAWDVIRRGVLSTV